MKKKIEFIKMFLIVGVIFFPFQLLAAPYYEGKTLKIIVGLEPGGGYDRIARLYAKHVSKHIPGKPNIVVETMTGAGSIIAANHLYNIAKPDGLTIGTFNKGLPFAQLLKAEGVKFDVTKFSWVGSLATEATVLTLRSDLPYKTFDDLRKAKGPIFLGTADTTGVGYQFPTLLKEFAGINFKIAIYPSSAAVMLAVERKEVDGRAGSYNSSRPYIDRGLVRPLARSRVSEPGIDHLPVNEDLITDPTGKAIMVMLASVEFIGRPFVAPPKTPPEIMTILWDAFSKATKDPALVEDGKKVFFDVKYLHGNECAKLLNDIFNQPPGVLKDFAKYVSY